MAPSVPPGQQSKGEGLPLRIRDAQLLQRAHQDARAAAAKLRHQEAVAGPTSGHE